jgi:hypothetical protein
LDIEFASLFTDRQKLRTPWKREVVGSKWAFDFFGYKIIRSIFEAIRVSTGSSDCKPDYRSATARFSQFLFPL